MKPHPASETHSIGSKSPHSSRFPKAFLASFASSLTALHVCASPCHTDREVRFSRVNHRDRITETWGQTRSLSCSSMPATSQAPCLHHLSGITHPIHQCCTCLAVTVLVPKALAIFMPNFCHIPVSVVLSTFKHLC